MHRRIGGIARTRAQSIEAYAVYGFTKTHEGVNMEDTGNVRTHEGVGEYLPTPNSRPSSKAVRENLSV